MRRFVGYYSRVLRRAMADFLRWGAQQVIGVLLAFAILLFQVHFGFGRE